ncbi:MAG TPA: hypothetical protein VF809_00235 [Candidatus Saccharimonadales bacterium]
MKTTKVFALATTTGILAGTIGTAVFAIDALACHPKGIIQKSVMNQTTGSALSDANDDASAIAAKPGDILKYVIEVRNDGIAGNNDMFSTKLTDTLPAGVELVSDSSKHEITEDLGTIKPGEKVAKEYTVKVTATKNSTINNEACFTGDTEAKDNPQKGCDNAKVKVTVPVEEPKAVAKTTTPTVTAPTPQIQAPSTTTSLPSTGASGLIAPIAAATSGVVAYAGRLMHIKRRQK